MKPTSGRIREITGRTETAWLLARVAELEASNDTLAYMVTSLDGDLIDSQQLVADLTTRLAELEAENYDLTQSYERERSTAIGNMRALIAAHRPPERREPAFLDSPPVPKETP